MTMSEEQTSQTPESTIKNDGETKSSFKKKLLVAVFVLDFFVVVGLIYYFAIFPRQEIQGLESGHVAVTVNKDQKADYKFVAKKPKNWVSLKDINYTAAHAIVVSEDWSFYGHNGYDMGQIKEAAEEALEGERTRGASTISQQVIKNLFLSPQKTLTRKLTELMYSTYMERNVSKEKILETYLNIAEFGPGIYGIKAASRHYFKKSPKELTPKEGAFLAMLLPSPKRYGESFRKGEMTPFATKTVNNILDKMVVAKYLKEEQLPKAKDQSFSWEKAGSGKLGSGKSNEGLPSQERMGGGKGQSNSKRKGVTKKTAKKRKKRDLTGKATEARYGVDEELHLEENPEFDEDAIVEDVDGLEAEFNVQ
jgi:monofunctional biosynthetic peptidoglycan transglycosylase